MKNMHNAWLAVWIVVLLAFVAGGVAVGIIKLMAWWQIAMNGCQGGLS